MELMVSREGGPDGLRIAHHLNGQGLSLCCGKFGEIYVYTGFDSVVMCGACVIRKQELDDARKEMQAVRSTHRS